MSAEQTELNAQEYAAEVSRRTMLYYFQERRRALKTELTAVESIIKEWEAEKVQTLRANGAGVPA